MVKLLIDFENRATKFLLNQSKKNVNEKKYIKQDKAYSVSQCCFFKGRGNIIQKVIFNFDDNFCV